MEEIDTTEKNTFQVWLLRRSILKKIDLKTDETWKLSKNTFNFFKCWISSHSVTLFTSQSNVEAAVSVTEKCETGRWRLIISNCESGKRVGQTPPVNAGHISFPGVTNAVGNQFCARVVTRIHVLHIFNPFVVLFTWGCILLVTCAIRLGLQWSAQSNAFLCTTHVCMITMKTESRLQLWLKRNKVTGMKF